MAPSEAERRARGPRPWPRRSGCDRALELVGGTSPWPSCAHDLEQRVGGRLALPEDARAARPAPGSRGTPTAPRSRSGPRRGRCTGRAGTRANAVLAVYLQHGLVDVGGESGLRLSSSWGAVCALSTLVPSRAMGWPPAAGGWLVLGSSLRNLCPRRAPPNPHTGGPPRRGRRMSPEPPGPGRARQGDIYRAGVLGRRRGVPTDAARARASGASARCRGAPGPTSRGGAGEGATVRPTGRPSTAGRSCRGCCTGTARRDLAVTLLGPASCPLPCCSPRRRGRPGPPRTATCPSRAVPRPLGVPYVISQPGLQPDGGDVRGAMGDAPPLVPALLEHRRAAGRQPDPAGPRRAGAEALVVTLDTTMLGWRPQDLNLGSPAVRAGHRHRAVHLRPPLPRDRRASASRGPRRGPGASRSDVTPAAVRSPAVHHPGAPRRFLRQPALPRAPGRRRGLPRHLLQPRPALGPPRHAARAARGCRSCSRGSCTPTTPGGRVDARRQRHRRLEPRRPAGRRLASPRSTRCRPSATAVGPRAHRAVSTAGSAPGPTSSRPWPSAPTPCLHRAPATSTAWRSPARPASRDVVANLAGRARPDDGPVGRSPPSTTSGLHTLHQTP